MSETIPVGEAESGRDAIDVRGRRPRVGIVLAAGRSERLAGAAGGGSKALVRVGGLTLIERATTTLLAAGLRQVVVVVGYQAGPVAAVVDGIAPGRVRAVLADDWEAGNGASLAAAASHVTDGELFVVVTADHLFGEGALDPLFDAGQPGVLIDHAPRAAAWAEGTRVRLREMRALEFSKTITDASIDCGAFVLPPSVFGAQQRAQAKGDASLAAAVTELAQTVPLAAVPLPEGSWWQDVDTRDDLRRAAVRLRRSLTKESDGPISRYFNRPISTRLSMALAHLPIHPDVVSLVAFGVALAAAFLLARGAGIAAAILVQLASIVDGMDGEIARLRIRSSARGAFLDGVLDRLADAAVVAGLAEWALSSGSSPRTIAALAVAAATGSALSMATKDRITALGIPPAPERWIGLLMGGRDARLLIAALAAVLGRPVVALATISITTGASLVARLLFARSRTAA